MKLYFNEISSAAARVRIALALKGLQAELLPVTILGEAPENRGSDYLRVNPQGLVPALVTDQGALLTQSIAIIEYLDELQPEPPLLPRDLEHRALVRAVAIAIAAEIHALVPPRIAKRLAALPGMTPAGLVDWNRHWTTEGLEAVNQLIAGRAQGPFIGGDQPGLADILLFPQVLGAERMGLDLSQWPAIAAVYANLKAVPEFAQNAQAPRK